MAKTVFIVPYPFIPPKNGGHWAAYGFAEFLAKERSLVVYTTFADKKTETPFTVSRLFSHRSWKYISPVIAFRFWRQLRQDRPQLIILHQHFMGLLLVPIAWLLRIPLAVYIQNLEYRRFRSMGKIWWPLMFLFEWWVYRNCRHLFFISPDELEPGRKSFGLDNEKCAVVPFGTAYTAPPAIDHHLSRQIREKHQFSPEETLILFFGPQSYLPNLEAVERIATEIAPRIKSMADFPFRFIICGGGLPKSHDWIRSTRHISYLGYVTEIEPYVQAVDLVINPVNSGGGVKTKLIEALALGKTVVSSYTGALGVDPEKCGEKLIRVGDEDFEGFAEAIVKARAKAFLPTPEAFYETYYWGNTIRPVIERMG